jgi:ABC-type nitrate/sulfonate/bicarbonate transport system substrate-binding protein
MFLLRKDPVMTRFVQRLARALALAGIPSGLVATPAAAQDKADRFVAANPKALNDIVDGAREAADWATANCDKVAAAFSETTGVDIAAQTTAVGRARYSVLPLNDAVISSQQQTADRFHKLGLIAKPILVRDAIWVRRPNS